MKKLIKIANAQGFWGDSIDAPINMINYGEIDYLTLDYLAEVTISIMQRQKLKNPDHGYARDFLDLIKLTINKISDSNIKIITNAGGANPYSCANKIREICKKNNVNLKVAVIEGDDIFADITEFNSTDNPFVNLETNESFHSIKDRLCSANVYLNSYCIKDALDMGADIVLCGRVTDPGLSLGPMLHEFNWVSSDYDKLASGTLAGHIIECGAQCTGGNYSRWKEVDTFVNIGYPIINMYEDGTFYISKPPNTGGLINKYTILEQVLYEMGDPENYISPDVIVDFTSFSINEEDNKVYIKNVKGKKATDTYKVSMSYLNGYKATGQLTIVGQDSYKKAVKISEIIFSRLKDKGLVFEETNSEYLGHSSCSKNMFDEKINSKETVLRISVKDFDKNKIEQFTKELAPVITNGPPGITGFSGGRPKIQNIIAYWPTLIAKNLIKSRVNLL